MTASGDRSLPAGLSAALSELLRHLNAVHIEFEPFPAFLSAEETTSWLRAWTGDPALSGADFRVFGQDGAGGYAAFWLTRSGRDVIEQPIVFLDSEGETGLVARNEGALLWLLADGFGPREAAIGHDPGWTPNPIPALEAIAERHAPNERRPGPVIAREARNEFPDFDRYIMNLSTAPAP